jgi:hypothetical protein
MRLRRREKKVCGNDEAFDDRDEKAQSNIGGPEALPVSRMAVRGHGQWRRSTSSTPVLGRLCCLSARRPDSNPGTMSVRSGVQ